MKISITLIPTKKTTKLMRIIKKTTKLMRITNRTTEQMRIQQTHRDSGTPPTKVSPAYRAESERRG